MNSKNDSGLTAVLTPWAAPLGIRFDPITGPLFPF
jgi:hypothetical protein